MTDAASYGNKIADVYDLLYEPPSEEMLARLAELAGAGGRALELGVGTGRVALPLVERGVEVHGIDASPAMVAKLRAKPRGGEVQVSVGDFAEVGGVAGGPFQLVYCVFNTFFVLLTQDEQLRCLEGVARVLAPGGRLVLELFVPDPTRFTRHQPPLLGAFRPDEVMFEASRHDAIGQRISSQLVRISNGGAAIFPIELRYIWPSELDLMARLAGMRLAERWGGWDRRAFGAKATMHVSVYEPRRA